jgi:GntR family transcriptional repressor for pyruvate dehydrogenase complex
MLIVNKIGWTIVPSYPYFKAIKMFKSVKPTRVTEEIVHQLLDLIRVGKIECGAKLPPERELAKSLGVSRTTLREALKRLEHNGVFRTVQGSGTYLEELAGPSIRDPLKEIIKGDMSAVIALTEFRTVIETWAAEMAALRADASQIKELKNIVRLMRESAKQKKPFYNLDASFHLLIAKSSKNSIYIHVAQTIYSLFFEMSRLYAEKVFNPDEAEIRVKRHADIFRAIEQRDPDKARKLMQDHFRMAEQRFRNSPELNELKTNNAINEKRKSHLTQ